MKKLFVLFAITLFTVTVNAQNNNFVVGQAYLGSQINHIPGCESAQANLYYTYTGNNAAGGPIFNYCVTCPGQGQGNTGGTTITPNVTVTPTINVSTVDREIELQKLRLQEMEMQMQADYNKKVLRQQKVANAFNGISTFGNLALGTSNQVALWNGKYQSNTNVQTDVWNVSNPGTNRPTDWNTTPVPTTPTTPTTRPTDWFPVNGTTSTPPIVNAGNTTWNTTPATTTSNTGWNTGTTTMPTTTTPRPGDGAWVPGW